MDEAAARTPSTRATTRWAWRIGRIAGVDLYVHATFPLLFLWIVVSLRTADGRTIVATVALTLVVFVIVVLHELGHALVALRCGIRTRDVTLLPIGGIARLERMPRVPRHELLVALAGPAVNLGLASLLYGALVLSGGPPVLSLLEDAAIAVNVHSALAQLVAINLWLAGFNLIPAFPMDGGRVLRAVLVMRTRDYVKATVLAARVGRAFAVVFAIAAIYLFESPILALVAAFVWITATAEAAAVRMSAALEHVPLSGVMITNFRTLAPTDTLMRAAEMTLDGFQHDFPVVESGTLVGMLTQRDLLRALAQRGSHALVGEVMQRDCPTVSVDAQAESAMTRLAGARDVTVSVMSGKDLVGVLTAENVSEFFSLRAATSDRGRSP